MNVRSKLFFCLLIFMLVIPQMGFAAEAEYVDDETPGTLELGESVKVEGELSEPEMSTMAAHEAVTVLSGPTTVKKFVRYLTDSWAKASKYTWSKTNTATSSITSDVGMTASAISSKLGVSNSVSTSYSVSITIPADSSRFSKLAYYSDYNKRYVNVKLFNRDGILYSDKNTYHYAPRKDTYLQVVYQ